MLRSYCGKPAIGFSVTVMIAGTDLKYLAQEQIDKVRENVGLMLHATEHLLCCC